MSLLGMNDLLYPGDDSRRSNADSATDSEENYNRRGLLITLQDAHVRAVNPRTVSDSLLSQAGCFSCLPELGPEHDIPKLGPPSGLSSD